MAGTVLLVHDDPALRKLLRLRLENEGAGVLEAPSAERAVELHAERADDVPAVVSGGRLVGMGGQDMVGALRRANPFVRVFFLPRCPSRTPNRLRPR